MKSAGEDKIRKSGNSDQLAKLKAIDCLEVGPVKIEKNKITATYKVINKNQEDSIDLTYSYEEDVFDPADSSIINLANMITAQVALNYGLFCSKIRFRGLFDNADQRFINDMAENTAREIYVEKILEPNEFLKSTFTKFQPIKYKKYCRARIEFPDSKSSQVSKAKWEMWTTNKDSHCILSSGGKDSLLSFGLINELGHEVHPIFVNESGRHWFTALNAYRYFKENVPNTARVWVNSDRVFNRMLRHLPFIREDFNSLRADEYPVRLWTVAVFLFGVLPLMKKRGISRLIIGDEFDSTNKTNHKGITTYDGLYDQSRYFDDAMSRYYMQKGWAFSQFSIIRPLSEMLIEKILVKRYPELQKHQVSCHATHKENERMNPCGKCEKCRRIVGMLSAIDSDPKNCGYTDKQINECLKALVEKGVRQEGPGREHLVWMLYQQGKLELNPVQVKALKEHQVILKLRFTPDRSPMTGIPVNLRQPLYRIFMQYAEGAVKKDKRKWIDFDPLTDALINQPYPFELSLDKRTAFSDLSSPVKSSHLWAELTWPEAEKRFKEIDLAILPVGAIEQHGPHLTLDVDAYDAEYLALKVAEACSDPKPLILPVISYGVSYHHDDFPGTISIKNETLSRLVYEIGISIAANGINKLVIINGHGGNAPALNYAAQMINRDARIFACVDTGETSDFDISKIIETPNDVHAGEYETSTALASRPQLVRMDKARKSVPVFSNRYLNFTSKRSISWYAHTEKISESGVMGDPTKATVEKGQKIWEIMIAHLVSFVEALKGLTLDEIYQKRY